MSPVPALDSDEFDRLLKRLARDIVDAAIYRKLDLGLHSAFNEYDREFNQSPTFWGLCFKAFLEGAVHRLARVYLREKKALSLERWLQAIKDNPSLFPAPPDPEQLDADLKLVSQTDPVVHKLITFRGNFIAHINWKDTITDGVSIGGRFNLLFTEIDDLIKRAELILNRYGQLFKRHIWSSDAVGREDFMYVLEAVRSDIDRREAEVAAEVARLGANRP